MITLPNGDKWVLDSKELEGISKDDLHNGNLPATSLEDFVRQCLTHDYYYFFPAKLEDGRWAIHFAEVAAQEIMRIVAIRYIQTEMFSAYEMPWGEVHVSYCIDGGHCAEAGFKTFPNREEYMKAVSL